MTGPSLFLGPFFRLCRGLVFANILLPISACPGNTSRFSISVPGPDQTQDPKPCLARGLRKNRGFTQRWHCRGKGTIKATGGSRPPILPRPVVGAPRGSVIQFQPGSMFGASLVAPHSEELSEARTAPGTQPLISKLLLSE